jgi:glycosyltransferase involved in cell wall biosynthesis
MSGSAHEPSRWDRKTETPVDGERFRRRAPAEPTMPPDTFLPDRFSCLAVVPAYNEAATIGRVIESLHRKTPALDVLVIDDGSTDATAQLAERAGAKVLRMPFNVGIGGAVQAGFKFAHENDYDFMVQVDGDGQHDPGEITKLFAAAQSGDRADMICGSRFATDTGYIAPISRRTGIHLFAFLLSRLLHQPITDPTSGFRLYNHRAIALFARDYPHDYPEVEAVLMLHHHRLTMREVPVRMFQRGGGVSSIGSGKSFYYMVKVLLALFVGLGRRRAVPEPGEPAPVAADHGI